MEFYRVFLASVARHSLSPFFVLWGFKRLTPCLKQYYKNGFGEVPNDGDYTAF